MSETYKESLSVSKQERAANTALHIRSHKTCKIKEENASSSTPVKDPHKSSDSHRRQTQRFFVKRAKPGDEVHLNKYIYPSKKNKAPSVSEN